MKKMSLIVSFIMLFSFTGFTEIKMKFGTLAPASSPWANLLTEFKKEIENESGGKIKILTYLGGSLGDERAMIQKMRIGQLAGGGFSSGGLSSVVPEVQVIETPFLFNNNKEVDYILDKVIFDYMSKKFREKGFYLYIFAENGWLDFGNNVRPIKSSKSFRGIKMFLLEGEVQKLMYRELKIQSIPLSVTEVLGALQTGMVQGYSITPVFAVATQWFTQTKYWTVSHHAYQPAAIIIDLKFWNNLPKDIRNLVEKRGAAIRDKSRSSVRNMDKEIFSEFKAAGIQITKLSASERAQLKKATAGTAEKLIKNGVVSKELYDMIYKGLRDFRNKK